MNRRSGAERGRCDRGFTLVEIMVALGIASLALTLLFQIFSSGLTSVARARNVIDATLLAKSQLAMVGRAADIEAGETSGTTEDGYQWMTVVASYEGDLPDPDATEAISVPSIYEVTVTVTWSEGTGDGGVTLATLRLGPIEE